MSVSTDPSLTVAGIVQQLARRCLYLVSRWLRRSTSVRPSVRLSAHLFVQSVSGLLCEHPVAAPTGFEPVSPP